MVRSTERPATDRAQVGEAALQVADVGVRTARAAQESAWSFALDAAARGQRFWWDQWRGLTEAGLATMAPVSLRQVDERLAASDRRADEQARRAAGDLDRVAGELRGDQERAAQEQARAIREVVREVGREQRAAVAALEGAVRDLDKRLNTLVKAEREQLEQIQAALGEQDRHIRERLGDQIRRAVGSIEASKPADIQAVRDQVAALAEAIDGLRRDSSAPGGKASPKAGGKPADTDNT